MDRDVSPSRWLTGLKRVGSDLAAGLPLPRLLASGMAVAQDLFQADRSAIFLGPPVTAVASVGLSTDYLDVVAALYESGVGGEIIRTRTPLFIQDVRDPSAPMGPLRDAAISEGFRTLVLAPLVYSEQVRGAIALYHDQVVSYSSDEMSILEILAEQLACAAESARRERKLESAREITERMVEELPLGIILVDRQGKLKVANALARKLFPGGSMRELLEGTRPLLDESGRPISPAWMPVTRALAGEAVLGQTVLVPVSATRVRSYLVNAIPLAGEALVSFQDTTDLRELDLRKDAFLQIVSHELRSPVTALRIYAGLLRRNGFRPDLLPRVEGQVSRLTSLLGKVLQVTELDGDLLAADSVNLACMAREVARWGRRLEPGRTVNVRGPESTVVKGDGRRLREALEEMVENALIHGAGPVDIEVDPGDERVVVRVSDRGVGVPRERLPFLFDRFSATRAALPAGGLGLGLYVAQAIARAHGGKLGYEERPAGGATFWLALPSAPVAGVAVPLDLGAEAQLAGPQR